MSYIVVSSYERVDTGGLQKEGEAVALFSREEAAIEHHARRMAALERAARSAREGAEGQALPDHIVWAAVIEMPLEVDSVDQALEDLETIIEEAEDVEADFGTFIIDYAGTRFTAAGETPYSRKDAIESLLAWLT
ncbi:hypothetical protein [Coralloluteibacterium thermophilus]|uniref:Uncharacterized protein n=1 Tax=Coralloluteibacterium thermophilum TaxID=2707049 RepID=A0ABV9NN64_9GAMM